MAGTPAANAVFDFENILPQLDFLPIAARRALDHAGLRLSLDAWRSLGLDDRCQLVAAGASDLVEPSVVSNIVRRAAPPAQRIEVVGDPDPLAPPDGLSRLLEPVPLDARQWARLRALDRYALAHVHRRSIARNDPSLIQAAYEDIVAGHLRSIRPPPGEAGGSVGPPPLPAVVPPPPLMPRVDGGRGPRIPEPVRVHEPTLPGNGPLAPPLRPFDLAPSARSPERTQERPAEGGNRLQREREAVLDGERTERTSEGGIRTPELPPSQALLDHSSDDLTPPPGVLQIPDLTLEGVTGQRAKARPPSDPVRLSSHLSEAGEARMVDVGAKPVTERMAIASAVVRMQRETFRRLSQDDTPKGDVLAVARIAGIQAAKRTSELIPLCHLIALTRVEVQLDLDALAASVRVTARAEARDRTGVEMEALVAASVASLTIYDMLKGIDRDISISDVKLIEKDGGRTGHYQRREA